MWTAVIRTTSSCAAFLVLAACASPSSDSVGKYSQDLDACRSQMSSAHPEMNSHEREKSCKQQVGPSPIGIPAKAPVAL